MVDNNNLNGWAIDVLLFKHIRELLPDGSTIVEFGSGTGTIELSKFYKVYSIEHDEKWLNVSKESKYIYAPIIDGWYCVESIKNGLKDVDYDLILVDGPPGVIGRGGILNFLDSLDTSKPIILDDTNRRDEMEITIKCAEILNKNYTTFKGSNKSWSIIN